MSGGYTLIAGVLLYIFMMQTLDSRAMNPGKAALIFTVAYFILQLVVMSLLYYAQGAPILPNLLNPQIIITVLLQFVVSAAIFYKVDEADNSFTTYILWGGLGLAAIFFLMPMVAQRIVSLV